MRLALIKVINSVKLYFIGDTKTLAASLTRPKTTLLPGKRPLSSNHSVSHNQSVNTFDQEEEEEELKLKLDEYESMLRRAEYIR